MAGGIRHDKSGNSESEKKGGNVAGCRAGGECCALSGDHASVHQRSRVLNRDDKGVFWQTNGIRLVAATLAARPERKNAMAIQLKLNPLLLRQVPLFAAFSSQQIETLLNYVQHKSYPRGVFVMQAGDETDSLYVILSGKVKVVINDDQGREVILGFMGAQDFLGERGILDAQPRSASVYTLENCEMLRLSKEGFMTCVRENSEVAMLVIRNLVKRLRAADRKIEGLALVDVAGRVARLLFDMAQEVDGKLVVVRAPAKQEVARLIGASREMVSRVFKELGQRGLIKPERRGIVILDRDILRTLRTPAKV